MTASSFVLRLWSLVIGQLERQTWNTSPSTANPVATPAGPPTMASGRGATRSSSASAAGYHDPDGGFHGRDAAGRSLRCRRSLDGGRTWDVGPTPCRTPGGRGLWLMSTYSRNCGRWPPSSRGCQSARALPRRRGFHAPRLRPDVRTHGAEGRRPLLVLHLHRPLPQLAGAVRPADVRLHRDRRPHRLPRVGPSMCTLFLTAAKANGEEGRVFCARTTDGGKSFDLLSPIVSRAVRLRHHARQPAPEPDAHPVRGALLRATHEFTRAPLDRPVRVR